MFLLSFFTDLIFYGFSLSTPLLGGLYLLRPRWRPALERRLAVSAGLLLAASSILLVGTLNAGIQASFSADELERYAWLNRITGPYWLTYWLTYWAQLAGQGLLPQVLWRRSLRRRPGVLLLLVPGLLGKLAESWLLRYYASQRDYLPSSWSMVSPNQPALLVLLGIYLLLLWAIEWVIGRLRR